MIDRPTEGDTVIRGVLERIARLVGQRLSAFPIQLRLMLAFLAVGVLPMLVSAWLAAQVVSHAFEGTVHQFLQEISNVFLDDVHEQTEQEAAATLDFLISEPGFAQDLVGRHVLSDRYRSFLSQVGYYLIALLDAQGRPVFANPGVTRMEEIPILGRRTLYRVWNGSKWELAATNVKRLDLPGGPYFLLLGTNIDANFISNINRITTIDIRLYYREGKRFTELYSSLGLPSSQSRIERGVLRRLLHGSAPVYDRNAEDSRYRALYTVLRDHSGAAVGILFCGLRSERGLGGVLDRRNLFLFLFFLGTVLSVTTALLLAQRMARPIKALTRGVSAIAEGRYSHRVAVNGGAEIAELGATFNTMAERLEEMQELERQLRRRDRLSALGGVAAGLAHELRNPLSIIKTSADYVKQNEHLAEPETRFLAYIGEEVERIDRLVSEFLAFAKPSLLTLSTVRPFESAERVCALCRLQLEQSGITVEMKDAAPAVTVAGDDNQIFQAVLNLVINAIEAMPSGGTLRITQAVLGSDLVLIFGDTGPGVPSDLEERIFNPFFTTKVDGTGLGLAKVFAVMESHGGRVECRSEADHGAKFCLYFPLRSALPGHD